MSKAILVVGDYPVECKCCPAFHHVGQEFICVYAKPPYNYPYVNLVNDCKLIEMPERKSVGVGSIKRMAEKTGWNDVYITGYVYGWNECLDKMERDYRNEQTNNCD